MNKPGLTAAVSPSPPSAPRRSPLARRQLAVVLSIVAVLALFTAGLLGYGLAGNTASPSDSSPEAGFARDMQTHHNQAVQMALIIRDKSTDPTLRTVAYDIATTQQQQSGQLYGWLTQWGLPQTSAREPMAWMTADNDDPKMPPTSAPTAMTHRPASAADATMPGMASPTEIDKLKRSSGNDAEILFLRLMIAHHRGGIVMAEGIQPLTDRPEVLNLARAIATAQRAEIKQMQQLLTARGVTPT